MTNQLRTITYQVQMKTEDGKNKGRAFQTTLSGISATSKDLQADLQKLGDKIAKDTGQKFEVLNNKTNGFRDSLKQVAKETSRTERTIEQMRLEYANLSAGVNRTADEKQKLNAIMRLGSNATLTQKKEVVKLVSEYQRLRNATNGGSRSMRNFRGQVNNAGFQIQDIVVQAQMGTNAFTIFSQQGSQLAASIGKNGPLIGAGIALAGVFGNILFPNISKNKKGVKELNEELRTLAETTGLTKAQSMTLVKAKEEEIKKGQAEIKQMTEKLNKLKILQQTFEQWKADQESLANGNASTLNFVNPANAVENYYKAVKEGNDVALDLLTTIDLTKQKNEEASKVLMIAKAALKGSTDEQEKNRQSNADIVESMEEQIAVLGLSEIAILQRTKSLHLQELVEKNATDAQIKSVEAMHDQLILLQRLTDAADEASKATERQKETEEDRLKLLRSLNDESTLIDDLETKYKKEQKLLGSNYKAQLALTEKFERDKLKIQGSSLERYMVSLEDNLNDVDELTADMLENFSQNFGDAFADAVFESDSLGDAMKNIFTDVGKNMVAFFAEWGAQELILWGLRKTLGSATQSSSATTQTLNAQAASIQSGINAFSSTAAIPIVGPALAPGAMQAALAVTQPMASAVGSLAFAGVYDKGGVIPQDALGIVAEYGQELVDGVLVKGRQGGTSVTSREDTAKMLNNTNNQGGMMFNITGTPNASPDQIANAVVRKIKRGRGGKQLDNALYTAAKRGMRNQGGR